MAKPKAGVQIEGLKELTKSLRAAQDKALNDELKAAHRDSADIVATAVQPLVPVRTGKMLSTLRTSSTLRSGRVSMGRKAVPYVGPIHFGWPARNIAPNPFMYDALDRRKDEVLEKFQEHMAALADKVNAGTA